MKTPKLTKTAAAGKQAVLRGVRSLLAHVRQRLARGYRLRFTPKAIVVCVQPPAGEAGGGGYVIPRSNTLAITRADKELVFEASMKDQSPMRVALASEGDAIDAMRRIQKRLLSNRPLVWTGRVVLLGFTWLLVSSYLQVEARHRAMAEQQVADNSGDALSPLPGAQSAMVAFPGGSSQQAAPSPTDATTPAIAYAPPVPPASPALSEPASTASSSASQAASLAGFGLDTASASTEAPGPAPSLAGASPTKGPGCDPALAFKAPAR